MHTCTLVVLTSKAPPPPAQGVQYCASLHHKHKQEHIKIQVTCSMVQCTSRLSVFIRTDQSLLFTMNFIIILQDGGYLAK